MKVKFTLFMVSLVSVFFSARAQVVDFSYSDGCFGDVTTLINTSVMPDSIITASWDLNGDLSFGDAYGDTVTYIFGGSGQHNVGLKVITKSGLQKATFKQISIGFTPIADFTYSNTCFGSQTQFQNLSSLEDEELEDFVWSFGDETTDSYLKNPSHFYTQIDVYEVNLLAISPLGCRDSITKFVSISDEPDLLLDFVGDTSFFSGDSLVITVIGAYDSIKWSTGQYGNTLTVKQTGYYTVTAYRDGCSASKSIAVTVKTLPGSGVMNIITPNGDGYNDKWQIFLLEKIGPCSVNIFNKWSLEVFSSSDYNNNWEGTFNGKPLQEGTYYYIAKCVDGEVFKGPINIIR
jgi:gliding motility-associated-like protein